MAFSCGGCVPGNAQDSFLQSPFSRLEQNEFHPSVRCKDRKIQGLRQYWLGLAANSAVRRRARRQDLPLRRQGACFAVLEKPDAIGKKSV
jgi:hypothetical protein